MTEEQPVKKEVLERIKKLLIKHDGCKKINSESEAEIALNLAFNLMKKHHLNMSAVLAENCAQDGDVIIIEKECEKFIANDLPVWIQNLVQLINVLCNTECILRKFKTNRSAKQLYINFIGEEHDVAKCIDMYKFFKGTASRLSWKHQREVKGNFTNWRSFAEGFTGRLLERAVLDEKVMQEEFRKHEQQETGLGSIDDMEDFDEQMEEAEEEEKPENYSLVLQKNELVTINRYRMMIKDKIKKFIKEQEAKKETLKESKKIDSSSFNQGRLIANQYSLTRQSNRLCIEHKGK